ncbi:MAG: hypothetical protein KatS3mg023_3886 [Armatimonadota bacterium]|nr:MAG: hypothetical protein KatS3mg023_3886 [Armatimonadota bacterium]
MWRNVFLRWIESFAQWVVHLANPSGLGKVHREHGWRVWAETQPAKSVGAEKARYTRLEKQFRQELKRAWERVNVADPSSLRQFEKWFKRRLQEYQAESFIIAKRVRGDYTPLSEQELKYLHGKYSEQMKYFRRFMMDVRSGRGRMNYALRLDLYAKDLWGIYQSAYWRGQVYTVGRRYLWKLSDAEHCEDCVKRAAESKAKGGYTWEELEQLGLPGEGKTRCLNNCKCTIVEVRERHYVPRSFRSLPNRKIQSYAELTEVNLADVPRCGQHDT